MLRKMAILLVMSLLITMVPGIGAVIATSDDNWYLKAKYGLYVTWQYNDTDWISQMSGTQEVDRYGLSRPLQYTCYPNGSLPQSIDELANAFDVEQFAQDCEDMGVQYVTFTVYHGHMYVLYPSEVVESRLTGHTSDRDLIRELIDALHTKGIKNQFYLHATIGDTFTEAQRAATDWYDSTNNYKKWNDFINSFFDEFTTRYGSDIDSIYIDMITDDYYLNRIDKQRLRNTILANCPNIPINGNGNAETAVDYGSREDGRQRVYDETDRYAYTQQSVVCLPFWWWSSAPTTAQPQQYYTPEHLFRYMVLTAGANTAGGGLAIGATPYATSGWEPGVKETLIALKNLIEPVKESIENTYSSTSYITPGGATIPALEHGITATRSPDNAYEYIHVLVPPGQVTVQHDTAGTGQNQFNYTGNWTNSADGHHYSNTTNNYVTVNFTGTQIKLYGFKDTMHGIMAVSIDGGAESYVDMYSSLRTGPNNIYTMTGLSSGSHTLRIRVTGTRNNNSTNYYASVARVEIMNGTSNTLDLPLPLDGKIFSSAVMLRTGNTATLLQDSNGVHITVPDSWDALDTVIKLTVSSSPSWSANSVTVPHSQMTVTASQAAASYPEYNVIDDNDATIWWTDTYVPNWVTLDIGNLYRVNNVWYKPRQDGFSSAFLKTGINAYNIKVSSDGVNFTTVKQGEWKVTGAECLASFPPVTARYVRLEAPPGYNFMFGQNFGQGQVTASELNIGVVSLTPEAGPVNLALNKLTYTDSINSLNEAGSKAVDGITSLYDMWCSLPGSSPNWHWITVDLGQNTNVGKYMLKNAGIRENSILNTRDFKLQSSNDNINWTDRDTVTANTASVVNRTVTPFTARYVRLYITNPTQTFNDRRARIYEFELYAE